MAQDLIDHYIDRDGIRQDTETILAELNKVNIAFKELQGTKVDLAGALGFRATANAAAGAKSAVDNLSIAHQNLVKTTTIVNQTIEQSVQARIRYQNTLKSVKGEEKDNLELLKKGIITQEEYRKRLIETTLQQEKYKSKIAQVSKEIKDQQRLNFAAPNSIKEAQAQNVVLTQQRNNTDVNDKARIAELNALIDRNNKLIDENSDKLAKQKINIGNYTGSFKTALSTLESGLDDINKKLSSGSFSGKELEDLTNKQKVLQNATQLVGKEFSTTTAQSNAYREAARQVGVAFGTNSEIFKKFNKEVGAGANDIKKVTNEVNKASASSSKFVNGFKGIFSVLRNLANVIPGLGISGLILLMIAPLKSLGEAFINLFRTIDAGKIKVQTLNEVNSKAVEGYIKEKSQIEGLVSVIKDNNIALNTRKEALKQLIDISPQYLKGLTLENIATEEGRKILQGYVNVLQKKSELQAAQDVQSESNKVVENLRAERQALVDMSKAGTVAYDDLSETQRKFLDNTTSTGRINFTASLLNLDLPKSDVDQLLKNIDKAIEKASVKVDASGKILKEKIAASIESTGSNAAKGIIQNLKDQIEALDKARPGLSTVEAIRKNVAETKKLQAELDKLEGKETKQKKAPVVRESTKATLDSEFELYKIAQERKKAILQESLDDEFRSYSERYSIAKQYYDESIKLINKQEDENLRVLKEKLAAQEANRKRAKGTELNNLLIEIKNTNTQIKIAEAKANDERIVAGRKLFDDMSALYDKQFEETKARYKKEAEEFNKLQERKRQIVQDRIDQDANIQELEVLSQFEIDIKGKTADAIIELEKKKDRELERIDKQRQLAQLQSQELQLRQQQKYFEAINKLLGGSYFNTVSIEKLITENKAQQAKIRTSITKKEVDDEDKDRNELFDKIYRYEQEAASAVEALVLGQNQRQKNDIQERIELTEKEKNDKIRAINELFISDKEKAEKIAVVEAVAQAKKEQLEQRQRRLDLERARFEKAKNISDIILNTLVEVIKAGGPLTPKGLQLSIFGALALAKAIATPIPKFKGGKNNDYQGLGIVDDGGKNEPILREDGTVEISTGTPTDRITYLKKKDIVFPSLDAMMKQMVVLPKIVPIKDNAVDQMGDFATRLENAIAAINIKTTNITKEGWREHSQRLDEYNKWVERTIKN